MSLLEVSAALTQAFEARGLHFEPAGLSALAPVFRVPRGWQAQWREGYAVVTHGQPPRGWLVISPLNLPEGLSSQEVLVAFLEEFLRPGVSGLTAEPAEAVERVEGLARIRFRLSQGGQACSGLALGMVEGLQARVVSYHTVAQTFQPALVEELLLIVLGSLEAIALPDPRPVREPVSDPAGGDRLTGPSSLPPVPLWLPPSLPVEQAFADPTQRFALKLPVGWEARSVRFEGDEGWILLPEGVEPGAAGAPFISVSGADLEEPLEAALQGAVARLVGEDWVLEQGPRPVTLKEQQGLVSLYRGPGEGGRAVRLWSLGVTDGESVVHLFAVAPAEGMAGLLPGLSAVGHSLRVLPRTVNFALARGLCGIWRALEGEPFDEEVGERSLCLRSDGTFGEGRRVGAPRGLLADVAGARAGCEEAGSGLWDVVGEVLTLYREDGSRERLEVQGLSGQTAVFSQLVWERL